MRVPRCPRKPTTLPWRRPRRESLLVALVAVTALSVVMPTGAQDASRWCLTRALMGGHVSSDNCFGHTFDRARYEGHLYSNKAPGMSTLAIPAAAAIGLPAPAAWQANGDPRLWGIRVLTSGLAFIACLVLVGRVSEGLNPGWGGAALVTFGLGTIVSSFAASSFDHVPAAVFCLAAFVLAWSRRPLAAGLAAGLAIFVEYEAALAVVIVGVYAAAHGWRWLWRYTVGAVPGVVLVAGYDWLAFGAPWHSPLSYSDNPFATQQEAGFLGLHFPTPDGLWAVLGSNRGLLVVSPVLLAALGGLRVLWKRGYRAEGLVCVLVATLFIAAESGYFVPYGGDSPGPRYFVPALPFLAVGLSPAFSTRRALTATLALISVIASMSITLTWPTAVNTVSGYRWSVWRELGSLVVNGRSAQIASWTQQSVLGWIGIGQLGAAAIVLVAAVGALAVAVREGRSAALLQSSAKPGR